MLIYEHSISGKKRPDREPLSHARAEHSTVLGSVLSSQSESNGRGPLGTQRPVRGGSMLGKGKRTTPFAAVELIKGQAYCKSSKCEQVMEKYFGGA